MARRCNRYTHITHPPHARTRSVC